LLKAVGRLASRLQWRRHRRRLLGVVGLCLFLAAVDYAAYPGLAGFGGRSFDRGENGLWLRYTWYFGEWRQPDMDRLVERLRSARVRYAYFHTRSAEPSGRLKYRYPERAVRLTREFHGQAPDAKAIAWVFVGNRRGYPRVDLSDLDVRRNLVQEAVWLVTECGFDGVQWDYEICASGDRHLIELLDETREALPEGKLVSVCTPMWYPRPWPRAYAWDESYFAKVAAHCDQLAVMCYDSAMYSPRAYVWLVRQQAARVTRAAARGNPDCRVVLGVPTYGKGGATHHARAESLHLALKGVREGLAQRRAAPSSFAGVSIFADWTTTGDEWGQYAQVWLAE